MAGLRQIAKIGLLKTVVFRSEGETFRPRPCRYCNAMLTSLRLASSRGLSALASRSFSAARQTQPLVIRNGTVVTHDVTILAKRTGLTPL